MSRLLATLIVVLASLKVVVWGQEQTASAVQSQEAVGILKSAVDRLRQAQAYTADCQFSIQVGFPGFEHERYGKFKLAVERPNRFLLLRIDGDMGPTLVSNGQSLTTHVAELDQFTQVEAPETLNDLSNNLTTMVLVEGGMGTFLMNLLADDPVDRFTQGVQSTEVVGVETIDGVECHHLRFVEEEINVNYWVTTGDAPTLRRIRPDLSRVLAGDENGMDIQFTISLDFSLWNIPAELPENTFAYTPPASAERVENFTALVPDAVLPPIVSHHPLLGELAPEFELTQLKGDKPLKLKDLIGKKVVVLDFWATWCPPCVDGLPKLAEVAEEFQEKPVAVYAVNVQEDAETIQSFLDDRQLELKVLLDAMGEAAGKYHVSGIPQTVAIGLDGRVHVVHTGLPADLKGELSEAIAALLKREDLAGKQFNQEAPGATEENPASR